jgi:4-hydroxythreonine-4-phosphate dehydrogenase
VLSDDVLKTENTLTLCLTVGDPTGIGPEITVKLLCSHAWPERVKLNIIGHIDSLHEVALSLGLLLPEADEELCYTNIVGNPVQDAGNIAYQSIVEAVSQIHQGSAHGLVTGPISKANLQASGVAFSGHTEILEHLAWTQFQTQSQADMLFVYQGFRLLLLTRHIPLSQVGGALKLNTVTQSLLNGVDFLKTHEGITSPRIAMLGVNPHAGEVGGDEELTVLKPAMAAIKTSQNVMFEGPFAADGFFRGFRMDEMTVDAIVSPYHDQGLIPFKMLAGLRAVNVTIGLPFIRTSVSHGTATDIAGRGIASEMSLICAVQQAAQYARRTQLIPAYY